MKVKEYNIPSKIEVVRTNASTATLWPRKAPGTFLFRGKENIATICSGKEADLPIY